LVERLAVLRARFGVSASLVSDSLDGFSGDVSELLEADGSSLPSVVDSSSARSGSGQTSGSLALPHEPPTTVAPAMVGPPWRVIFGDMAPSSS
jgi:hypothetical protein